MLEIVNSLLDKLEEIGYECRANYVNADCCGELYTVDYGDLVNLFNDDKRFRIQVKNEKIIISTLSFKKIHITHAEFKTPEQVIKFIKYCNKIDSN